MVCKEALGEGTPGVQRIRRDPGQGGGSESGPQRLPWKAGKAMTNKFDPPQKPQIKINIDCP